MKRLIFCLLLLPACSESKDNTLHRSFYEDLHSKDIEQVYDIYLQEISVNIFRNHAFTNANLILGKRGQETLEILAKRGFPDDSYQASRLFQSIAYFSKIDVCRESVFGDAVLHYARHNERHVSYDDCEHLQNLAIREEGPAGMFVPKFRE